jgi:tetratricopeptide (TPR) repeat protein
MYLRGSKWSMRQRRKPTNWFLVIVLLLLIAGMVYFDRFVVPPLQQFILPTATPTRDPESYVTEADGLFNQGKFAKAIDTYTESIRISPSDPTIYVALARVQVFAGKYDDAVTNAQNALLLNPNNSMAMAVLAWAQDMKGDYTAADASIQEALKLDANNGNAHAYYAFLLGDLFQNNVGPYTDPIKTAGEESRVATSLAPNSLEAHWARGRILYLTANYEEAVSEFRTAIGINAFVPQLHLDLGVTYKGLSLINEAIKEYTLANTLNPSDYTPYLYSSRALGGIGSYAQAAQYAEQAVNDAPTIPYLRGNWGWWLYENGQFAEALTQLSLAVNGGQTDDGQAILPQPLTPDDIRIAQYYYIYALLLAKNDRCGDALPITQQLLNNVPDDADAVYNAKYVQGLCKASLGTPPAATGTPPKTTPTP